MTETAIIEAVRAATFAAGANGTGIVAAQQTPDPQAVDAFQQAMHTDGVSAVPFGDQVAATWNTVQADRQVLLHRISTLSQMSRMGGDNMANMVELQYQVANLSFQQEIVTSVAKKSSDAVSTLVKNG